MSNLMLKKPVLRVLDSLKSKGLGNRIKLLNQTARSAQEAANVLGVELGAIVKTLIFEVYIDNKMTPVACLISGDKLCNKNSIKLFLNIDSDIKIPNASSVKLTNSINDQNGRTIKWTSVVTSRRMTFMM